jgi:class 3 adenylate cyclase
MRTSIYAKIFSLAIGLILLMVVVAIASSYLVNRVGDQLRMQSEVLIPINNVIAGIEAKVLEQEVQLEHLFRLHATPETAHAEVEDTKARLATLSEEIGERFSGAYAMLEAHEPAWFAGDASVESARIGALLQGIEREYGDYFSQSQTVVALMDGGRPEEIALADRLVAREEADVYEALDTLRTEVKRYVEGGLNSSAQHEAWLGVLILILTGGAILLGLPAAAIVTRGLVAPIKRLITGVQAVRSGDLAFDLRISSRDEVGQLAEGFREMVAGLRAKQQITETFGKYVDPRVVERLIEDPELSKPGGDRREMTVFFSDIAGFTRLSTELTASSLLRLLNRYFEVMTVPIRESGGVIDKYIGDAIMAYWGPPFVAAEVQAGAACEAALNQLPALAAFRAEVPEILGLRTNAPQIEIRVGLASGPLVVGSVGSEVSRNYTVIGDTVNLASRLEGACKLYHVQIVVDQGTRMAADACRFRELDSIRVWGRSEPVRIFELRGFQADGAQDALAGTFERALAAYRTRAFDIAEAGFKQCLEIDPGDGASRLFLERLGALREQPPGPDWDGVWTMTSK